MSTTTRKPDVAAARFCGHCPTGSHRSCHGSCACADQDHRPDDLLAGRLGHYLNPTIPTEIASGLWQAKFAGKGIETEVVIVASGPRTNGTGASGIATTDESMTDIPAAA